MGGGTTFLTDLIDQSMKCVIDVDLKQILGQGGVYGFFDISDYATVYGGFLFGIGDVTETISSLPADSPLLITLGADGNWALTDQLFVRVPVEVGYALNTRLPSSFYSDSSATYKSSYGISIRTGASLGYKF